MLYGALSFFKYLCFIVLIASGLCVRHAYILMLLFFVSCMFGWSFALLYDHCGHFLMTILCLIKLLICFTSCLLDHTFSCYIILVLYHLIYLKGLMYFVQVFQVTGIHVLSSSQVLDLGGCECVLPLFPNSRLSLEFVIRCFVTK